MENILVQITNLQMNQAELQIQLSEGKKIFPPASADLQSVLVIQSFVTTIAQQAKQYYGVEP